MKQQQVHGVQGFRTWTAVNCCCALFTCSDIVATTFIHENFLRQFVVYCKCSQCSWRQNIYCCWQYAAGILLSRKQSVWNISWNGILCNVWPIYIIYCDIVLYKKFIFTVHSAHTHTFAISSHIENRLQFILFPATHITLCHNELIFLEIVISQCVWNCRIGNVAFNRQKSLSNVQPEQSHAPDSTIDSDWINEVNDTSNAWEWKTNMYTNTHTI